MEKSFFVKTILKQAVCATLLVGAIVEQAQAQMANDAASTGAQSRSIPASTEQYGSPTLPRIVNTRPDSRSQQFQSQAQTQSQSQSQSQQFQQFQQYQQFLQNEQDAQSDQVERGERPTAKVNGTKDTFGTYVYTVTGTKLRIFGKNLFTGVPSTFAPLDAAQVNSDYVIGTGDELQIRAWGMLSADINVTVDRSGTIYIPQVGAIKVAGVRYGDLQGYLKQVVGKIFSNFELSASISQTRAVQIYVVGHAVRPGTYTLSSLSTLLNAVFTSGGPDASGSMRNIQLKRRGETVTTFDLYDMLIKGDKSRDASLRDGDVIYIPETGPMVALTGNVKTPAIFEMKGPTSLAEVVAWAGGIDASAQQKNVVVERTVNNAYKTVTEFVADDGATNRSLAGFPAQPADVIRIFAPSSVAVEAQIQRQFVRLSGEVKQSGVFEIRSGETLRELLVRMGGITENGYLYGTQFTRESVRRTQQAKLDEVADRYERDIESAANSRLAGSIDKDAAAVQTAELERQRRAAQQLRSIKAEGRIVLELDNGNAQVKNLPDLPLQDGDNIIVPRRPGTVEVIGAVFQSNSFIYKPNRTVNDYIRLAGGETDSSDRSEIYIIRADGVAKSATGMNFFGGIKGETVNAGDTVVVPEKVDRSSWRQSLKEWTSIFYQFGLGAAGLKVLKD